MNLRVQPHEGAGAKRADPANSRVAKTTCYMCACRCGIDVHLADDPNGGRELIRYIEGNRDHPVNRGVLCAKGSAGIMQHNSPARLRAPLKRVGPRGSGQYEEISWDEALELARSWLAPVRERDPSKLAFFTGRDQSQSLTSFWAQSFGTPNYAAHGGFCSVNMAAGGIYTIGGSFWEFGAPDWEKTKLFLMFGVAEDHSSNPLKLGLAELKRNGARFVSVNPVRTGYSAIADNWIGIKPGTDGLFVLSMIYELFRTRQIDLDYAIRYTNAPWLVIRNPGEADHGLFARDGDGRTLVWDREANAAKPSDEAGTKPSMHGEVSVQTADGERTCVPVMQLMAEHHMNPDYAPDVVGPQCDIDPARIRGLAAELARVAFEEEIVVERPWTDMKGERHERMIGRPISMHAMRGISAHSNGFQTTRAIHVLQVLLGSIDCPGGFRYKPPYPKPFEAHPTPHGALDHVTAGQPLKGPHLGYPRGPEGLLLEDDGETPRRIDWAYSWDAPLAAHGMMQAVIPNAAAGEPYNIDVLFMYMANMAWNSSMSTRRVIDMLTAKRDDGEYVIPKIIYSDAYESETVHYADLVLPDTTYLERHDCISLLDRPISEPHAAMDSIRWPVVEADRDVRGFQSALIELGVLLKLPAFTNEDGSAKYSDYADYIQNHERKPGIGPLAGWRGADGSKAGRGEPNPDQIERYKENGGFFVAHVPPEAEYFKHANSAYQDWAVEMGFLDAPAPVTMQLYSEVLQKFVLAADGHGDRQPPERLRERIRTCFNPLPFWYPPHEGELAGDQFPLHAVTQRPAAMYHSWGSMNAWLRQIHTYNPLFVPTKLCEKHGLTDGDWAWVTSHHGRIKCQVKRMDALNDSTMWTWNAIGKRKGAWGLDADAPEAKKGFLLNHLIDELLPDRGDGRRWQNADPVTGQAAWYDLKVSIEKAHDGEFVEHDPDAGAEAEPVFPVLPDVLPGEPVDELRYGEPWSRQISETDIPERHPNPRVTASRMGDVPPATHETKREDA